ncbi:MAG: hypothetical protein HY276_10505 [Ignavibacteriales bacterium]|nr:hypothetical protein [Ignavibacteriales bacterium]
MTKQSRKSVRKWDCFSRLAPFNGASRDRNDNRILTARDAEKHAGFLISVTLSPKCSLEF